MQRLSPWLTASVRVRRSAEHFPGSVECVVANERLLHINCARKSGLVSSADFCPASVGRVTDPPSPPPCSCAQSPTRSQTGLLETVCFDVVSKAATTATRCFQLHVSKCRYCAQEGESLKSLAESYFTGVCLHVCLWCAGSYLTGHR